MFKTLVRAVLFFFTVCVAPVIAIPVQIFVDKDVSQVTFGAQEIASAFREKHQSTNLHDISALKSINGTQIMLAESSNKSIMDMLGKSTDVKLGTLRAEGFSIRVVRKASHFTIWIIGADSAGTMYGSLELAEVIRVAGLEAVKDVDQNPYMAMRGTKFNIPLDARTPSYTDVCDAAQKNIPEMWSMAFWKEYIDTLAQYRYNYISLWSMHPFPSLVKVPEYPDVALDDVKRSKGPFKESYSLRGIGWAGTEFDEDNLETIKTLTIDEKITFWRQVMAYGKSRNVDFYIITWNIFDYGIDGKYGITDNPENETTIDYFRKSVRELILTYPDLAGIGLTTGENMYYRVEGKDRDDMSAEAREDWMVKTYAAGTLDALKSQPGRKIRFIHRQHMTGADMVLAKMRALIEHPDVDFIFSFKYAKAHVYSATRQPYHEDFVPTIRGKVKTIWTLRNDDIYLFRWAAPDFVREFVKNIPQDVSQGYYYGYDGFTNGREFTQLDAESPRQLEVRKHWLQWMLWGRFAYNPDYSNDRIAATLSARYPEVNGVKLLDAWQKASMVYPRVTGFHWGSLDFMWYIEGIRGISGYAQDTLGAKATSGFHDVETFLSRRILPHTYAGVQSIQDYIAGKATQEYTPISLADLIDQDVEAAEKAVLAMGNVQDKELRLTLDDIKIICEMGRYYADKIRGATYVAMARESKKKADKAKAIEALTRAAEHYKNYVERVTANHLNQIWFNRVGILNFKKQMADAMADIDIAKNINVQ
ncbi:carbohydrate-binding family 6 protein [Planctomycetota bacterium]